MSDLWFLLCLAAFLFLVGSICAGGVIVLVLFLVEAFMQGVCVSLQWLAERF
jgi:hypothetical protein